MAIRGPSPLSVSPGSDKSKGLTSQVRCVNPVTEDILIKRKAVDLRQDLADRGLNTKGNKSELIHRLLEFHHLDIERPSGNGDDTHQINCKCGVVCEDGRAMVECSVCLQWSHLHCYNLSDRSARLSVFSCHACSVNANVNLVDAVRRLADSISFEGPSISAQSTFNFWPKRKT